MDNLTIQSLLVRVAGAYFENVDGSWDVGSVRPVRVTRRGDGGVLVLTAITKPIGPFFDPSSLERTLVAILRDEPRPPLN